MSPSAPADATYLLLSSNPQLANARTLLVSSLLSFVDGGAGNDFEIFLDQADLILANLPDLAVDISGLYLPRSIMTANGDLITRAAGTAARLAIGSDGDVLTVASGLPSWAAPSGSGAPPWQPPYITGNYYGPWCTANGMSSSNIVANRQYFIPFYVPTTTTFDSIAIKKAGAGAANYRLGIYGPATTDWASMTLVLDAGAVAAAGAGMQTIAISQALTPGWYALSVITDTTATVAQAALSDVWGWLGNDDPINNFKTYAYAAQTYGALPSPSSATPSYAVVSIPYVMLRAA